LVGVVALLSAACDGGNDADRSTSTTSSASRAASTTATTDPLIKIVLQPARLLVGGNALPFGAPLFQVSSFLERGLGDPTEEADRQCDAGELRVLDWPTITVFLSAEGLAGWYTGDDAYSTDKGIAVGASQSELLAAYPTGTVTETSLGSEFFFDAGDGKGLSAVLDDGEVTTLWSGATCIAR
jgi:hypothetical protein